MNTKVCSICKQEKSLIEFATDNRAKDGLLSRCRACQRVADSEAFKVKKSKRIRSIGQSGRFGDLFND